jgi:hypothetical protein
MNSNRNPCSCAKRCSAKLNHIKMLNRMTNEMMNQKSHKDNVMLPYVSMTNEMLIILPRTMVLKGFFFNKECLTRNNE